MRSKTTMGLPPRSLSVQKFADARAPEVEALYSIIKKRIRKRNREGAEQELQDFAVPRNQRRRTTSYLNRKANLWRKRKRDSSMRHNYFKIKIAGGSGSSVEDERANRLKKLCRRVRRRIELKGGTDGGFGFSRDGTRRLVTHVWHAKRFTMTKKWGYYLPLGLPGRGRGSRAVLKWSKSNALLHDASYYSAVQLEGPEDSILEALRMVLESSPSSVACTSQMSTAELDGVCYGTAMLHKVGECPYGLIAPVTYLWRPPFNITSVNQENEQNNWRRHLWIWVHAAAFDDAFHALQSACQRQSELDGVQIICLSRRGELGRVDILGSRALERLQKILCPISWSEDSLEPSQLSSQISQISEAHLLAHADKLPVNGVLAMDVYDPRDRPVNQNKYLAQVSSLIQDNQSHQTFPAVSHNVELRVANIPSDMQSVVDSVNEGTVSLSGVQFPKTASKEEESQKPSSTSSDNKTLWDSQSKGLSVDPPMSENVLSKTRHQQRLAYFYLHGADTENANFKRAKGFSRSCPIMLLKNDNQKPSACGWSIILPINWVRAFWIPLVLSGARVIGLRERRWLSSDAGLPLFPNDFPDCKAYEFYMNEEAAAYVEIIARQPPSKRHPSILVPPPWNCIQRSLNMACNGEMGLLANSAEAHDEKSVAVNVHRINLVDSVENEFEILKVTRSRKSVSHDSFSVEQTDSYFPGFVARTSMILRHHLKASSGLHLLLFPETYISERKDYFRLMEEGRLGWSLKGVNNLIIERDPCFLRVLLYALGKGTFEEGAVVCAPTQNDFAAWLSSSQRWQGLEIPPTLRNADCIESQTSNGDIIQSENKVSKHGRENLRQPIGFVTTGVCQGRCGCRHV
eukprot:Gb_02920 [translate_table: standard]